MDGLTIEDGRIIARTPFKLKDVLKSVLGAKWESDKRAWSYPATPQKAKELAGRVPYWIPRSNDFTHLAEQGLELEAHQIVKQRVDLPEVPITGRPSWNHQKQAYWFAEKYPAAMLYMGMGTGKTKVVVDLVQNKGYQKVLILAPKKVIEEDVWGKEFAKYCVPNWTVLSLDKGTVKKRTEMANWFLRPENKGIHVVAINYDAARNEPFDTWSQKQQWDLVVCDESQKIKSPGGATSRYASRVGKRAKNRLALTGTPLAHGPLDAYAQYRFLDDTIFGTSFVRFRGRYAIMGGYGGYEILGYHNEDEFNQKFYSIAYHVGSDILDLPPYHHVYRECVLGKEARAIYNSMRDDFIAELGDSKITASNALVKLLRLQEITGGWLDNQSVDTSKAELLAEVIDEIEPHESVVVFARFRNDITTIHKVCHDLERESFELSGSANQLTDWRASTGGILVVQIQAGGLGIDLTKAHYGIYYSKGFSLGDYEQSLARIHRPGQKESTTYVHLIARSTVDEKVEQALREKQDVIKSVLESPDGL